MEVEDRLLNNDNNSGSDEDGFMHV